MSGLGAKRSYRAAAGLALAILWLTSFASACNGDTQSSPDALVAECPDGGRFATTTINLHAALAADSVVPPPFGWPAEEPNWNLSIDMVVFDSLGVGHLVFSALRYAGALSDPPATHRWEVFVMRDEHGVGDISGPLYEITPPGGGRLEFRATGELQSQDVAISTTFGDADPTMVRLVFGDDMASGGTGRAATQMLDTPSSVVLSVDQDGCSAP